MTQRFTSRLRDCLREEEGQDLTEYALIAALIGVAAVMFLNTLSQAIGSAFNSIGNGLANGTNGGASINQ